jgi:hypothetical protein
MVALFSFGMLFGIQMVAFLTSMAIELSMTGAEELPIWNSRKWIYVCSETWETLREK